MTPFITLLIITIFAERILKHLLVIRFFRRSIPPQTQPITLVSCSPS